MTRPILIFDAVAEAEPGPKWAARWRASWPAYEAWFRRAGGDDGPSRAECEAALARHMPELAPIHRRLTELAGGGDRAARFLSTWRPPVYLGGCSAAAVARRGKIRLVRNYDLAPELNEGLLLRSEWTGAPVMGMVEFLWGLSDGVNAAGLCLALNYGGRREVAPGFGVTTILRYVLETCGSVPEALAALRRVPSHMAYNVTLADRGGRTATAELIPGGGARVVWPAIATNHQHGPEAPEAPVFSRTFQRHEQLARLVGDGGDPDALADAFLEPPLFQTRYAEGFGTLFTAVSDPERGSLTLRWPDAAWRQTLDGFEEGRRVVRYAAAGAAAGRHADPDEADPIAAIKAAAPWLRPAAAAAVGHWADEARGGAPDWAALGKAFAA